MGASVSTDFTGAIRLATDRPLQNYFALRSLAERRFEELNQGSDPLVKLNALVDREAFPPHPGNYPAPTGCPKALQFVLGLEYARASSWHL